MTLPDPTYTNAAITDATWTDARVATSDSMDRRTWREGVMHIFNTSGLTRTGSVESHIREAISYSAWIAQ